MPWETYDDSCKGCEPVLFDVRTMKKLPDNDPAVIALMKWWGHTTLAERQAFHRVTCLNSRAAADLIVLQKIQTELAAEGGGGSNA